MQLIPLDNSPNQTFQATLGVNGKNITLGFGLSFNEIAGYWVMKISDPTTGEYLLDDIPLIIDGSLGANLLAQYEYLEIGEAYLVRTSPSPGDYPDADNLGKAFQLIWGDNR